MAAAMPSAGLEAMITVKVQFEGSTRRTKMPLREMVPDVLEANIRTFLHIPVDSDVILERYSDSAAAYVYLDTTNVSVYKQLYRAAKAKSKLKIRASILESKPIPKPVSVEDEPETAVETPAAETPQADQPQADQPEPCSVSEEISPIPTPAANAPVLPPIPAVDLSLRPLPFRTNGPPGAYDFDLARLPAEVEARQESEMRHFTKQERHLNRMMERRARACLRRTMPPPSSAAPVAAPVAAPLAPATCPVFCPATGTSFAVCCNNCEKTIPNDHYHCSTCDDGDFDLCQACIDEGVTCRSSDHWLIKRSTVEGRLVQSTTERVNPKPKAQVKVETTIETTIEPKQPLMPLPMLHAFSMPPQFTGHGMIRTCNSCVQEYPEKEFVHCTVCEDYDLCQPCFSKDRHGHHPNHGFTPAVADTEMPTHISVKMAPGRNKTHHAICDGCDKHISGVRHKCLDCPDWDYCAMCVLNTRFTHPNHRFVPIYEQLSGVAVRSPAPVHVGICCDGPLCSADESYPTFIRGIRYKCAVCHDTDFCANCEASPSNAHNKTHPLIKFKTPVRRVSVTTTGEHGSGERMPSMGDQIPSVPKVAEAPSTVSENSMNAVQTIVDVKPSVVDVEQPVAPKTEVQEQEPVVAEKEVPVPATLASMEKDLGAAFVQDTIADGTIMPPNYVFEQTWTLRNDGDVAWPAGCSVRFVGGDYMGHVDSNHPAGIAELVSASESTVCYAGLAPGQQFSFTVLLRTPARAGRVMSYWRLTSPSGLKFGHRLWCDVNVRAVKIEPKPEAEPEVTKPEISEPEISEPEVAEPEAAEADESLASSQMIFPKLEKESPVASVYQSPAPVEQAEARDAQEEDWDLSGDDGFQTDEEYDILDASDEEYLEEQKKKVATK